MSNATSSACGRAHRQRDYDCVARFWSRVNKTDSCWLWTGSTDSAGYGTLTVHQESWRAHRYSWMLTGGSVESGMHLDHKCHQLRCVNPSHLQVTTPGENGENRRGPNKGSASGVRNVSPRGNGWIVQVSRRGVRHNEGPFSDTKDAEAAAIALRNRVFTNNLVDRSHLS